MENTKPIDDRVTKAYNELMTRLFDEVPKEPGTMEIERDRYTEEMESVQKRYGLKQGDPDFLEWVLTLVGRSPVLTHKGEIVYDTRDYGARGSEAGEEQTMGEAPPS